MLNYDFNTIKRDKGNHSRHDNVMEKCAAAGIFNTDLLVNMLGIFQPSLRQVLVVISSVVISCPSHSGLFIGVGTPRVEIGGDMDGTNVVGGGGSAEILPEQAAGDGTKFSIGTYTNGSSFDINFVETNHTGDWQGISTESTYQSLNFDWKGSVFGKKSLRGLFVFGMGFSSVKITNGSTDGATLADARFKGMDFRIGAGIRYQFIKKMALELNVIQRYGSYSSVDGLVSGSVADLDIDGNGISSSVELMYIF